MTTTTTLTEQVPVLAAWYDDGECWTFDVGADHTDHDPSRNSFVIDVDPALTTAYQTAITAMHDAETALVAAMGLSTEGPELVDTCPEFELSAYDRRVLDRFPLMSGLRCGRCGAHRGDH